MHTRATKQGKSPKEAVAKVDRTRQMDEPWEKIFKDYPILEHDFTVSPYEISAEQIRTSCQGYVKAGQTEVRILCKHDKRESRPKVFADHGLFMLPKKNGTYLIIRGEGYVDIPAIKNPPVDYRSKLEFELETSAIGDSEMQHVDYAYATSIIRTFTGDPTLVLTIRGRKFTQDAFEFQVGNPRHVVRVESVQTEVDGGYEGKEQVVLIEAKNASTRNVIIRQLYYPFRKWQSVTKKKVRTLFFEKSHDDETYSIWQFEFTDPMNYHSAVLVKSGSYKITSD